jgi:hypothetical protein
MVSFGGRAAVAAGEFTGAITMLAARMACSAARNVVTYDVVDAALIPN